MSDDDDDRVPDGTHGPLLRFRCTRLQLPSLCAAHLSAIDRLRKNKSSTPKEELRVEAAAWDPPRRAVRGRARRCPARVRRGPAQAKGGRARGSEAHRRHRDASGERETSSDQPGAATFNQSGLPSTTTSGGSATLTHLAAGRNVKATASAVRARDPRLRCSRNPTREIGAGARRRSSRFGAHPRGRVRVGACERGVGLLAGEVAPPPEEVARLGGKNNDDNNGLTWRENFGLHLWFGRSPTATLASALEGYLHAIEKGAAEFPAAPGSLTIDPQARRLKDVCFNILALASSGGSVPDDVRVEKTFHPLTYCKDDLTNVALAWHLFVAMRAIGALGKGTKVAALADEMHVAFASQLLAAGAGAVCRGGGAREEVRRFHGGVGRVRRHARRGRREAGTAGSVHAARAVRGLCDDEGKTSFLRDVLGVPTPWLEEARREWCDYNWWEAD